MCDNCSNEVPNFQSQFCDLCHISIVNMNKGGGSDSDDDDMAFGESPSSTPPGTVGKGFHKIAVKRDQSTGDITGW